MATKVEIRDKALKKLGVLPQGQTATAEQGSDLEKAYDEVYAYLDEKNLISWESTDDVPDAFVFPIVSMVAYMRVDEYAVSNQRYQRVLRDASQAEGMIREINAGQWFNPTDVEDF